MHSYILREASLTDALTFEAEDFLHRSLLLTKRKMDSAVCPESCTLGRAEFRAVVNAHQCPWASARTATSLIIPFTPTALETEGGWY